MSELQQLLDQFFAGDIGREELPKEFESLLRSNAELALAADEFLESVAKDSRLSGTAWLSLKKVLEDHLAAAFFDPELDDPGRVEALAADGEAGDAAEGAPETLVLDPGSTARGSDSGNGGDAGVGDPQATAIRREEHLAVLRAGSVIGGRYELIQELGGGGMGKVFKARDRLREEAQDRHPFVALKILSDEFREHPDSMIALQREARRAQTLAHPNVITVHEFFRDGPHLYITMELLDGKPLDELLRSEYWGGLSLDEAWPIIDGVCRALKYGHEKNIVHSDIKPANIFICDDGTVKVVDLGIARPMRLENVPESEQTTFDPGKRLGSLTPAYASLEMWYQEEPHPADDIYALACVSYMLLAGVHPFKGKSAKKAAENNLVPERIESLTHGQWSAILDGLAFHRKDRIKSVDEFLSRFSPQSVRRKKMQVWGLAAVLAAVVIGFFGLRAWEMFVVDRAIADRERLQTPVGPSTAERRELTAQEQAEVDDMIALARLQLASVGEESSANELIYFLGSGPNNVSQLTGSVLEMDPGNEAALELRQSAFELFLDKARRLEDEEELEQAMALTRNAETVIPNTGAVFRLQEDICDHTRPPAGCVAR